MITETIHPINEAAWLELRKKDITSTEVGALFGINPRMTHYELWHRKHEKLPPDFEPNDRIIWGQRLQDSIAAGVAKDQGWDVRRMDEYIRDPELRMGASFDFSIENAYLRKPDATGQQGILELGILEVKNVDALIFRDQWITDENEGMEAPPHIEIQLQHQLACSGRSFGYIAALIGGNRVMLIRREADQDIIKAIRERVKAFWESIDKNIEPAPDFQRDADFISKLYGYAEPGKVYDGRGDQALTDMAVRHKQLGDMIKKLDAERDGLKAQMIVKIGDAEKVLGDGFSITASIIGECPINYVRSAYRTFKANWPRTKK